MSYPEPLPTLPRRRRPGEPLPSGSEWRFDLIERYDREIARVAERYGLDTYPNQLEIITAEQMMDAYASIGMPVNYRHWTFGKEFIATEKNYKRGHMGLAYEIVINSNPCISYLMEENTMAMQALVIAHAGYGHNSFFKGNYLFRMWTDADVDHRLPGLREELRRRVRGAPRPGGGRAVARLLPRARQPRRRSLQAAAEAHAGAGAAAAQGARGVPAAAGQRPVAHAPAPRRGGCREGRGRFPEEPQENLLYFIEKNAPLLEPWQREIVRIVRKVAQYFYPQRQTQVMNEGWATFWHYTILQTMYDDGLLTDGLMMELLKSHTNVLPARLRQPVLQRHQPLRAGLRDVQRHPAHLRGARPTKTATGSPTSPARDWLKTLDHAMRNFKDESFIAQYLSPKLMRDFRLFCRSTTTRRRRWKVAAIHDDPGYRAVREALARSTTWASASRTSRSWNVNLRGDRSLTLRHFRSDRRPLATMYKDVMKHLAYLWGFTVRLETANEDGTIEPTHEIKVDKRRRPDLALAAALRTLP